MRFPNNRRLGLVLSAGLVFPAVARAADILRRVPADCSAVLIVRDPQIAAERINQFIADLPITRKNPVKLADFMRNNFDLKPGTWDRHRPVVLMLQKVGESSSFVIGFTRSQRDGYAALGQTSPEGDRIHASGPNKGFGTRVGGQVFISPDRAALERVVNLKREDSLAAHLTASQRALLQKNDLFFHLRMEPWQTDIDEFFNWFSLMLKGPGLLRAFGGGDPETTQVVFDWLLGGCQTILKEMKSVDAGARLDDSGFTLTHLHEFDAGGKVAKYLSSSRRAGIEPWIGMPDRPFMMAMTSDWQCPQDIDSMESMARGLANTSSIRKKLSPEQFAKWRELMREWFHAYVAMSFMVTVEPDGRLPMEMLGAYTFEDAARALQVVMQMNQISPELSSFMLPTGWYEGDPAQFRKIEVDGVLVRDMPMTCEKLPDAAAAMIKIWYGSEPRVQTAQVAKDRIAVVQTRRPDGVKATFESSLKKPLGRSETVKRVTAQLPDKPHAMLIFDLGNIISIAPQLAAGLGAFGLGGAPPPSPAVHHSLFAWSMTVGPTWIRGDAHMPRRDAIELIKGLDAMAHPRHTSKSANAPGQPAPNAAGR